MVHNYNVIDSSLWDSEEVHRAISHKNTQIYIGMVQEEVYNSLRDETLYMVELMDPKGRMLIPCIRMVRFGSPFNYEEYTRQTYDIKDGDIADRGNMIHRPGEAVIVSYLTGGEGGFGVILGAINHPYRSESLPRNNEVAYVSEFNGIETYITKDGEYRQTYRGIQKNVSQLTKVTGPIPEPIYDMDIGGSYVEWKKDGSWLLTDRAKEKPQSIKVAKKDGYIEIISGDISVKMSKKDGIISIVNKKTTVKSADSIEVTTKKTTISSSDSVALNSNKFNIKAETSHEGKIHVKGNVDIKGEFELNGALKHKGNTEHKGDVTVNGDFTTIGTTSLAGGNSTLITDIILIIGTGNLGAPVVSNATVLTTTKTKAT